MVSTAGAAGPVSYTRPRCNCLRMFSLPKPAASASAIERRNGSCASLTPCRYSLLRRSSKTWRSGENSVTVMPSSSGVLFGRPLAPTLSA